MIYLALLLRVFTSVIKRKKDVRICSLVDAPDDDALILSLSLANDRTKKQTHT